MAYETFEYLKTRPNAQRIVVQPTSSAAYLALLKQGFTTIPQAPQLVSREILVCDTDEFLQELIDLWPDNKLEEARFLLTDAPPKSRRLLVEFLNARSLSLVARATKFEWFSTVLQKRKLFFVFQPLIDLRSGVVVAHECLVRGKLRSGETLSGYQLIEAARATQMMWEFDEAARLVCLQSIQAAIRGGSDRLLAPVLGNSAAIQTLPLHPHPTQRSLGLSENGNNFGNDFGDSTVAVLPASPNPPRTPKALNWLQTPPIPPRHMAGRYWVNVMPNTILGDQHFVENLVATLPLCGLSPRQITLELTEIEAIDRAPELASKINELQQHGFMIALDDLYGSVSVKHHLMEAVPNYIKLDQQLVRECSSYRVKRVVIDSLVRSAHDTGIVVVAEGLESLADIECCRRLGVDLGQGFGLGMPDLQPLDIGKVPESWSFDSPEFLLDQVSPGPDCHSIQCNPLHCNRALSTDSHQPEADHPSHSCRVAYPQCSLEGEMGQLQKGA